MKKIFLGVTLFLACFVTTTFLSAKSEVYTLYGQDGYEYITKANVEQDFHTSVNATYMNESTIRVFTSVQRRGGLMDLWQQKGSRYDSISQLNVKYDMNFRLGTGTQDTRAMWGNDSRGTTITARFYINNGLI